MHVMTRIPSSRRLLLGVAVAGLLGLTACGSSAKDAAGSSATTAAAGASSDATTAAKGGDSATTAAKSTDTTAAKSSGSGGDLAGAMVAAFNAVEKGQCDKAKTIGDSMDLSASSSAGLGQIGDIGKAMEKLASSGPSELRPDFATMATAFTAMGKAYDELGLGDPAKMAEAMKDPAKMAKFTELSTLMEGDGFTKASENISVWMQTKCPGLDGG